MKTEQRKRRRTKREVARDGQLFGLDERASNTPIKPKGAPPLPFVVHVIGRILLERAKSACGDQATFDEIAAEIVKMRFPRKLQTKKTMDRVKRWMRDPLRGTIPGRCFKVTDAKLDVDQSLK